MTDSIAYLLLGLGAGAFYALMATGIVVAYKGAGVINFAHGAIAMFVAFQFYYLRVDGDFQLPWVDILPGHSFPGNLPVRIDLADEMSLLPAAALAMATALLLGLMAHFIVFRPLRRSAPLGKVIGSLGFMLYLQGVALKNFGADSPNPRAVLPDGLFRNFLWLGKPMPQENLSFALIVAAAGTITWAIYHFTRFGLATRAAADNEKGALLIGYSPDRLALANWLLSAVLAGLAGILVGSITGALNPVKFTGLIVPALGAALIGRLVSIPWAMVGGFAIGMLETWTTVWLTNPTHTWWPDAITSAAAKDALPLLVIVAVLYRKGTSLPIRGALDEQALPRSPYPRHVWQWTLALGTVGVLASTGIPGVFGGLRGIWALAFTTWLIMAMIMLSYVVLTGYAGQISLAQMSLAGVAAFITARLMANGVATPEQPFAVRGPDWPWPVAALVGVALAVVVGVLVGMPAVRIRGVQLAVVSISAAVFLQTFFFENEYLTDLSAGSNAILRDPSFFGIDIKAASDRGTIDNPAFMVFCVVVLALLCLVVSNLRRGVTGRRLLAVRSNERAAASAGLSVPRTKLMASGIASAIAGVGGVMLGFQQHSVSSAGFVYFASLTILAFVYLGGTTSVMGALLGGLLAPASLMPVLGDHYIEGLTSYQTIAGGAAIIATAVLHPEGQAIFMQKQARALASKLRPTSESDAPAARTHGHAVAAAAGD